MSVEFPKRVRNFASTLSVLAGILIFIVGGLTVADVLSRNLRGQSILGVMEISTLVLVAIAFLGLAAAEINGQHVSVSLFEEQLGRRSRLVLSVIRGIALTLLGVILVIGMFSVLEGAISRQETTNDILRLPTWPAKLVALISYLLFFVIAIWKEIMIFRLFGQNKDPFAASINTTIERDKISSRLEDTNEC